MKKGTSFGYVLLLILVFSKTAGAQYTEPLETDSYLNQSKLLLDSYTYFGSTKTWFNKDDGSLLVYDKINDTIDTIATLHSGFFEATNTGFYIYGDALSFVNIQENKIFPVNWNNADEFIQYFKLIHSNKAVLLVFSAMRPEYYLLDLKTTQSKPIRNPDPYENPIGIETIGDQIFMASTHTIHSTLLESGKWIKLAEKSSDTGDFNHITASDKEVFLSSENGIIFRFDGNNPTTELTKLSSVPPFDISIFESSKRGTLAIGFENRIAVYNPSVKNWVEIPADKLTFLKGSIRKISFVDDKTLLITTGQSFGLVSIRD